MSATDRDAEGGLTLQRLLVLGLAATANLCAACQLAGLSVAASRVPGLLGLPERVAFWFPEAFLIGVVCITPLAGYLAGRFGAHRVLWGGLWLFLASAGLAAATTELPALILAHLCMGAALAPVPAATRELLEVLLPGRFQALGTTVWACGTTAGALVGSLAVGFLLPRFGWPGVCLLGMPATVLAMLLLSGLKVPPVPPSTEPASRQRTLALFSLPLCLGALGYVVNVAPDQEGPLDPVMGWILAGSALALAVFLRSTHSCRPQPVLDLGLLRLPSLRWAVVLALGVAAFSTGQLETLFLGQEAGMPTRTLGLRGSLGGLGLVVGSALGGALISRCTPLMASGLALVVLSLGKVGFLFYRPDLSEWAAIWPAVLSSVGYGLVSTTLSFLAFLHLHQNRVSAGASFLLLAWQFGGAFGLALMEGLYKAELPGRTPVEDYLLIFRFELFATLLLALACLGAALWQKQSAAAQSTG